MEKTIKKWKEFQKEQQKNRVQYGLIILKIHERGASYRTIASDIETSHQHVKNLIREARQHQKVIA
jgi:DNA-directed RNA polymerase specialized sigma24 family protein